jgi:hypothetical protein
MWLECKNYVSSSSEGDRINAVLADAGYNFSLLLRWLAMILPAFFWGLARMVPAAQIV